MNSNDFKAMFKYKLVTALTLAPALGVMILSTVYQLLGSSLYGVNKTPSILMGWLTVITVLGSVALAVIYDRAFTTSFFTVLFGLGFVSYIIVTASGSTSVLNDSFFDMLLAVFILPVLSYISIFEKLKGDPYIPTLITALLLALISGGASAYITVKRKKREKELEKQADPRPTDSSRRKIR